MQPCALDWCEGNWRSPHFSSPGVCPTIISCSCAIPLKPAHSRDRLTIEEVNSPLRFPACYDFRLADAPLPIRADTKSMRLRSRSVPRESPEWPGPRTQRAPALPRRNQRARKVSRRMQMHLVASVGGELRGVQMPIDKNAAPGRPAHPVKDSIAFECGGSKSKTKSCG